MGALRRPARIAGPADHRRQRSCDSVCAAIRRSAWGLRDRPSSSSSSSKSTTCRAARPRPRTRWCRHRVRGLRRDARRPRRPRARRAALDPKEQAAYALDGLYDKFELPSSTPTPRASRWRSLARSNASSGAAGGRAPPRPSWSASGGGVYARGAKARHGHAGPPTARRTLLTVHAERELGANSLRVLIANLERRAPHRRWTSSGICSRPRWKARSRPPPPKRGTHRRLGEAVGERLHARAAAGSMARRRSLHGSSRRRAPRGGNQSGGARCCPSRRR